ncbi:uncharacterized protein LOC116162916 [Photinus pyralis]|uniref:uncharacterized protein LOC116162916 n=1 Tax=Photinus pyralis TaxID=7054 RepID=UPI001267496E|nr:uncharacterized protein LOC116162916 [Photinus pyralis]
MNFSKEKNVPHMCDDLSVCLSVLRLTRERKVTAMSNFRHLLSTSSKISAMTGIKSRKRVERQKIPLLKMKHKGGYAFEYERERDKRLCDVPPSGIYPHVSTEVHVCAASHFSSSVYGGMMNNDIVIASANFYCV